MPGVLEARASHPCLGWPGVSGVLLAGATMPNRRVRGKRTVIWHGPAYRGPGMIQPRRLQFRKTDKVVVTMECCRPLGWVCNVHPRTCARPCGSVRHFSRANAAELQDLEVPWHSVSQSVLRAVQRPGDNRVSVLRVFLLTDPICGHDGFAAEAVADPGFTPHATAEDRRRCLKWGPYYREQLGWRENYRTDLVVEIPLKLLPGHLQAMATAAVEFRPSCRAELALWDWVRAVARL